MMDHVDVTSPVQSSDQEYNGFSPMPDPCNQKNEPNFEVEKKTDAAKSSSKSAHKRKKISPRIVGRRYNLRSSLDGVRVLRSMKSSKTKSHVKSVSTPVNPVTERRIKRRKVKRTSRDELLLSRKRVRYVLTRMNYEQSLIDAYSGEGWRGQSQEKIKPEKELERAKSEIIRCKLKLRDLFHHLDSLSSDGRFQESLFDSEGQISSEDIFCAKCGSKTVSADNDIVLCDGICDRGFHQKCLDPPLLSEDIPAGDEGWLCPSCDCKVDCLNILNEVQGSDLGIENTWEDVFPEAAGIVNGDKQYDESSNDSEDNDYDPDAPDDEAEDREKEFVSDESDSTSAPEDPGNRKHDSHCHDLGYLSDDSEDDDYGPDDPEPTRTSNKDGSTSDESDFTSDSDDFCEELRKTSSANRISGTSSSQKSLDHLRGGEHVRATNNSSINSERLSPLDSDLNQENVLQVSAKRQSERLDYKKLYDEAYGKTSSDTSDDEDWSAVGTRKQGKKNEIGMESTGVERKSARIVGSRRSSSNAKGNLPEVGTVVKSDLSKVQVSQEVAESTPKKVHSNGDAKSKRESESQKLDYSGDNKSSSQKKSQKLTSQKLLEVLKENEYPTRAMKENLAEELGMTFRQVSKWFDNARHSLRVSAKESSGQALVTPDIAIDNDVSQTRVSTSGNHLSGEAPRIKTRSQDHGGPAEAAHDVGNVTPDKGPRLSKTGTKKAELVMEEKYSGREGKRKILGQGENKIGGGEGGSRSGVKAEDIMDSDRQKAIERELRKRRQNR